MRCKKKINILCRIPRIFSQELMGVSTTLSTWQVQGQYDWIASNEVPEAVQVMNTSTSDWHGWPGGVSNWENDQGPPPFKLCSLVARRARVLHWRSSSFSVGEPNDLETYGSPMLRLHEFNVKSCFPALGAQGDPMTAWGVLVSSQQYKCCFLNSCSCLSAVIPCTHVHVCPGSQAYAPQLPSHSGGDLVLLAQTWSQCVLSCRVTPVNISLTQLSEWYCVDLMKYLPLSSCKFIKVHCLLPASPFLIYVLESFMRLIALPFIYQGLRLFWGTFD